MPRLLPLAAILIAGPAVAFDPAQTGTVAGRVVWAGDRPTVPPLDAALLGGVGVNPYAPRIDPTTRGLAGAVVSVANLPAGTGRPWDWPPVRVEATREAIRVVQGAETRAVGFVRRGGEVTMASAGPEGRSLRGRGAAYFTLAFPEPGRPLTRRLDTPGVVRFTSGTREFWTAADVFVCDHPYFAVTGPDGSFTLPRVPAGEYELAVWVPNWHVTGKDRDPETGLVSRVRFAGPVRKPISVRVTAGGVASANASVRTSEFIAR